MWRVFLWLTNNPYFVALARLLMGRYMAVQIRKQIPAGAPIDVLVAVHFNPAQVVDRLAETLSERPRAVIVATDYDPHWSWVGKADAIVVASDSGERKAQAVGYRAEQVLRLQVLPNEQAIGSSSLAQDKPVPDATHEPGGQRLKLLMVSGQDGSNPKKILSIIESLDASGIAGHVELDVVCGKNILLKRLLDQRLPQLKNILVRAHGFVPGLHQKIAQADLMIMRASPQILSECISAGVPVVAFDWSVHEVYQAELINSKQLGFASKKTAEVLSCLEKMVTSPAILQRHKSCTRQLAASFDGERLLQHVLQGGRCDSGSKA